MGDMNGGAEVLRSSDFGRNGGAVEASAAHAMFERVHTDVLAYLVRAMKEGTMTLNAQEAQVFYTQLREEVVGKEESWSRMVLDASSYGRASAGIVADIVEKRKDALKDRLKDFMEKQVKAGSVGLDEARKTAFFIGLTTATTRALGGVGRG